VGPKNQLAACAFDTPVFLQNNKLYHGDSIHTVTQRSREPTMR
jgi:hypothetical protein